MEKPQMTKDKFERVALLGASHLDIETFWELIALARRGLRLLEPPTDGDYLRQLHKEFDCGCETCARTAAVCPATASSLFQEVAILREHRDRLTAELDSLRKDKERLKWAIDYPDDFHRLVWDVFKIEGSQDPDVYTAIDSAMRKE